jgi:hypothetical protein
MEVLKFFLWVIFALLVPDSESGSGYGSIDLIESGSIPHHTYLLQYRVKDWIRIRSDPQSFFLMVLKILMF